MRANISRRIMAAGFLAAVAASARAEAPSSPIGKAWEDPRNPIVRIFGGQRLDLWSLRPITRPQAADVQGPKSKVQSPIDSFIVSRLHEQGLDLQPAAAKAPTRRGIFEVERR